MKQMIYSLYIGGIAERVRIVENQMEIKAGIEYRSVQEGALIMTRRKVPRDDSGKVPFQGRRLP